MEIRVIDTRMEASSYLAEIIELLHENLVVNMPDEGWTMEDARFQAETLLSNLDNKTAYLFVATDEGELNGFAWTYIRQLGRKRRLHINHIIVQSGLRGGGIGRKILDVIIKKAAEMQMDAVDLLSSRDREEVVRFYTQNGFSIERFQMVLKLPKT
jgi:ribosomal protein S18 acetylase RimI-like enzyme